MGAMIVLVGLLLSADADAGSPETVDVSMVQLLVQPNAFEGKRVRLVAYLAIGFEESALYFHKEDYDVANTSNALWLGIERGPIADRLAKTRFRRGWVLVEGTFEQSDKGHLSAFPGGLSNITRVTPWKPSRP